MLNGCDEFTIKYTTETGRCFVFNDVVQQWVDTERIDFAYWSVVSDTFKVMHHHEINKAILLFKLFIYFFI